MNGKESVTILFIYLYRGREVDRGKEFIEQFVQPTAL